MVYNNSIKIIKKVILERGIEYELKNGNETREGLLACPNELHTQRPLSRICIQRLVVSHRQVGR